MFPHFYHGQPESVVIKSEPVQTQSERAFDIRLDLAVFECAECHKHYRLVDPGRCISCGETMMLRLVPDEAKAEGSGYDPSVVPLTAAEKRQISDAATKLWSSKKAEKKREETYDDSYDSDQGYGGYNPFSYEQDAD